MVTINSFIWKKQKYPLYPPILFKCGLNEETGFWEVIGDGPYEDLLVYGEKLSDALQILKEEILPILLGRLHDQGQC